LTHTNIHFSFAYGSLVQTGRDIFSVVSVAVHSVHVAVLKPLVVTLVLLVFLVFLELVITLFVFVLIIGALFFTFVVIVVIVAVFLVIIELKHITRHVLYLFVSKPFLEQLEETVQVGHEQLFVDVHVKEQFDLVYGVDAQQTHLVGLNLGVVIGGLTHLLVVVQTDCDVAHFDALHELTQNRVQQREVEVVLLHFCQFHLLLAHFGFNPPLQNELTGLEAFLSVQQLLVGVLADPTVHEVYVAFVDFQDFAPLKK